MKIHNFLLTVIILGFSNFVKSQDFQGQAIYVSKAKMEFQKTESKSKEDDALNKMMEEALKKASEATFILTFNKQESIFEKEQKLETPQNGNQELLVKIDVGNDRKKYKNLKEQKIIAEGEIIDKHYLIVDELQKFNWNLINETKTIGNYLCNKAEIKLPVTQEQIDNYQEDLKSAEIKTTNFYTPKEPKPEVITAWYTIEIPVSIGPDKYWGLPGLILELKDSGNTFLCSKITLNPKNKIEIKAPKKGKIVSQKEFNSIEKKAYDKINEDDSSPFNSKN